MKMRITVVFLALCAFGQANAQLKVKDPSKMASFRPKSGTVCYMGVGDAHTFVPPPDAFLRSRSGAARTKSANIEVTYENFSPEAQAAFQEAVEIWESLLTSSVTIHILARWAPLGSGVLGGAGPGTYYTNFDGAHKNLVWYPVALAEKMARKELNLPGDPDIVATFNSNNSSWHYDINTTPGAGKYDLVTIVLHEIGHGLGITRSYEVDGEQGVISAIFDGLPVVYETNIENLAGVNLVTGFQQPSAELRTQLISQNLFYNTPLVLADNNNLRGRVFAPATFTPGSSIAHLDDATYPGGSPNALMTPFINSAERALNPGPIIMNILKEIGWVNTNIQHIPLVSSEDVSAPYEVKCTIISDSGFDANSVKLNYAAGTSAFTTVPMTPTGNANEFNAFIPVGNPKYAYFISVDDNDQRTLTKPGTLYKQGQPTEQNVFKFESGPDNKPPFVNHIPVEFISKNDTLVIEAVVSDNIGVQEVELDFRINGVDQPTGTLTLEAGTDSTYVIGVIFTLNSLLIGDQIEYRIRAKDSSLAGNVTAKPSTTTYFDVNVAGLGETQDSYINDFNSLSTAHFFGNGFTVAKPAGFENGAIHSDHPYQEGNGAPDNERNFVYNLDVPVRVKSEDAIMRFDEIVLVEPGEPGSVFGTPEFYDYVVVEGSSNGGVTWIPLDDGYDSRDQTAWLTIYNSSMSNNNSTAVGEPSLYKTRAFNLLDQFNAGDEVAFRFRLFSDQLATGWGWAIDNLRIQPLQIQHQHVDYVLTTSAELEIKSKILDSSGTLQVFVDYNVNGGTTNTVEVLVDASTSVYTTKLGLTALGLNTDDELQYRIRAIDDSGNESTFPASGFLKAAVVGLTFPVSLLTTDFESGQNLVSGNFFSVTQPQGFANKAMHSNHGYDAGLAIEPSSNISWIVKTPFKVNASNPFISFDEIVLTEYSGTGVKDYVIVEASKDGLVWEQLLDSYSSNQNLTWKNIYDNGSAPLSSNFLNKKFSITASGAFKADDVILIRFRLFSDEATTGWGWAVDNLRIQVDEVPPQIRHQHVDYVLATSSELEIKSKILDASGGLHVFVDYNVNGTAMDTVEVLADSAPDVYTTKLGLTALGLETGDELQYRIRAIDESGNQTAFPPSGFLKAAVVGLTSPVSQVVTDFEASQDLISGNFFSAIQLAGFTNKAMHSKHGYDAGLAIDPTTNFSWIVKAPITVNGSNPFISFDEIVLAEYSGTGVKDYVVVEASKDGLVWEGLLDPYSSNQNQQWKILYDNGTVPFPSLFMKKQFSIMESGTFKAGDVILIRFRMFSDAEKTGWGWAVDNLSIQGPITGVEMERSFDVVTYPNPVKDGLVHVRVKAPVASQVLIQFMTPQGQVLSVDQFSIDEEVMERKYPIADWPTGLYLVKVEVGGKAAVKKIIKAR